MVMCISAKFLGQIWAQAGLLPERAVVVLPKPFCCFV
jgi:hypothetical protein